MDRTQKTEMVDWIGGVFDANTVVVVANSGLTVTELEGLRSDLRKAGANIRIVKNRLAKIAIKGKPSEEIAGLFQGPTAIAFSEDPVAAAKAVKNFSKDNDKLTILGGVMGDEILDVKAVEMLAAMPSREELLGSIVSAITSSASNIASAVGAPASGIAGILETLENREAA